MSIRKHYQHQLWWSSWTKERYEQSNLEQRRHYRSRKKSLMKRFGIRLTSHPDIDAIQQLYQNRQEEKQKQEEEERDAIKMQHQIKVATQRKHLRTWTLLG